MSAAVRQKFSVEFPNGFDALASGDDGVVEVPPPLRTCGINRNFYDLLVLSMSFFFIFFPFITAQVSCTHAHTHTHTHTRTHAHTHTHTRTHTHTHARTITHTHARTHCSCHRVANCAPEQPTVARICPFLAHALNAGVCSTVVGILGVHFTDCPVHVLYVGRCHGALHRTSTRKQKSADHSRGHLCSFRRVLCVHRDTRNACCISGDRLWRLGAVGCAWHVHDGSTSQFLCFCCACCCCPLFMTEVRRNLSSLSFNNVSPAAVVLCCARVASSALVPSISHCAFYSVGVSLPCKLDRAPALESRTCACPQHL
jgi:hypothetical protein